jgi:hypothetical protein
MTLEMQTHLQPGNLRFTEGVILHQFYHVVIQQAEKKTQIIMSWSNQMLRILYSKQ